MAEQKYYVGVRNRKDAIFVEIRTDPDPAIGPSITITACWDLEAGQIKLYARPEFVFGQAEFSADDLRGYGHWFGFAAEVIERLEPLVTTRDDLSCEFAVRVDGKNVWIIRGAAE